MRSGYEVGNDRGKLIMACGTGKTFTALKLAEQLAADAGGAARVLFLVPSVSLLGQSLRSGPPKPHWISGRSRSARTPKLGGCATPRTSTSTTSRSRSPPTRPPWPKRWRIAKRAKGLTVVFSTYQSLPAVADAQGSVWMTSIW